MVTWLAMLVACGGGGDAKPVKPKAAVVAKAGKAKLKKPRAPVRIRPPFFDMPRTAAGELLGENSGRELLLPIQKGPFGPGETLTMVFEHDIDAETEGVQKGIGGFVIVDDGNQKTAHPLKVVNDAPLIGEVGLLWVNGETGWQPVLKMKREGPEGPVQANQAFEWNGKDFVHSEFEPQIATLEMDHEIQDVF